MAGAARSDLGQGIGESVTITHTLMVNEVPFPVSLAGIDAELTQRVDADLGVDLQDVAIRLALGDGALTPHEVVAVMVASLVQSDEPADHRFLLKRVGVSTKLEMVATDDDPDEPVAAPVAPEPIDPDVLAAAREIVSAADLADAYAEGRTLAEVPA